MKFASRLFLVAFLFGGASLQPCRAELSEVQVKSAYVFNFIKFVEWPANTVRTGEKLNLCIFGDDRLHVSLSALEDRKTGEYELHVARVNSGENLGSCHVLYIGEQEQRRVAPVLKSLRDAPVLTISDIPGFAERGGGIGLLTRNNKMLFEVNLASTRNAGLRLSSQMLNLAANIFGK
jgi:hypothetical protein